MIVTFVSKKQLTDAIYTFYFKPERPFRYDAGQFVDVTIKHAEPDNRGHRREFTLSSAPTEELLAITTRVKPRSSSFKKALAAMKLGDTAFFSEPSGDFVLPINKQLPLVFITHGLGMTPVRSILKKLQDTDQTRAITLFRDSTSDDSQLFNDLLIYDDPQVTIYTTKPDGFILNGDKRIRYYISGPPAFVQQIRAILKNNGATNLSIIADTFTNY